MRKSGLLRALQAEIRRHSFDTFVYNPPSIADGGPGVVVPGTRPAGSGCSRWRISWIIWPMMFYRVC
jgi:hypothetical protein